MPRYLIQASYNSDAAAAFVSNPQDRVAGVRALTEKLGGKLESFDFALGEHDVIAVGSFPAYTQLVDPGVELGPQIGVIGHQPNLPVT